MDAPVTTTLPSVYIQQQVEDNSGLKANDASRVADDRIASLGGRYDPSSVKRIAARDV